MVVAAETKPTRLEQLEATLAALQQQLRDDHEGQRSNPRDSYHNKNNLQYWNCNKIGHMQQECGHRCQPCLSLPHLLQQE
ncbi:hypothetical protein E2C01_031356 [Portunus trituberculatus]|uniref:Uncharacterized protein n=1 Tax=Portunus trituberculatus TaxID=210409 RepID=A0A5B7ET77_PORTR|nr:hypothetical protein [Portunus trituberculatus]